MSKKFTVIIASNDKYDKPIAEIHYDGEEVAIVSQDGGQSIEIYPPKGNTWAFPLDEFMHTIEHAQEKLREYQ